MIAWIATVSALCGLWCVLAWRYGPQRAIGCQVLIACLVPTWVRFEGFGLQDLPIDCRVISTVFGLVAYCIHPRATFPWRLGWLDAVMLSLVAVHIASDIDNTGWSWLLPLRVYGEWCVPYLAGRLALQSGEDMRALAPVGLTVALVLAVGGAFEGITGYHPWEWIYGERDYDGIVRDQPRWGVTRAWGCCAHPIYFGFLQVLFMPWLLRLWHKSKPQPVLWVLPLIGLLGVYATASRAPLLAYLSVPLMGLFAYVPKLRIPMVITALLLSVVIYTQWDRVLVLVTRWGETVNTAKQIVVDDETVQASGTMTRIYLLKVYRRAAIEGGFLGYGTDAVTGFPVRVPTGPQDKKTLEMVPYIDNQFMLMTLRFGGLGLVTFSMGLALAVVAWLHRSQLSIGSNAPTCFYIGGTILAVAAGLLTVWMPHDIGFPLLWWMGAGSSTLPRRALKAKREAKS